MAARLARRSLLGALVLGACLPVNAFALGVVPTADEAAWPLFGRKGVRVPDGAGQLGSWNEVLRRARVAGSPTWRRLVERVRRRSGGDLRTLLRATNSTLNRIPYRPDEGRFPARDRWLDPDSFVTIGGDCEDFAIAKYFLLRRSGIAASRLRVVTGYDHALARGHALLVAEAEGEILVLDNRFRRPVGQQRLPDFQPRLSFNESDLWLYH